MNKICTSLEQSKKLIELGIDVNTADMMWTYDFTVGAINGLNVISEQLKPEENDIPAWSLTALLDLIQDDIKIEKTLFDQSDMFTHSIIGDVYEYRSHEHENLVDAAFEMVCWLLENKKL